MISEFLNKVNGIRKHVQDLQAIYSEKNAEYLSVCKEVADMSKRPPSRADFEKVLLKAVHRYADRHEQNLDSFIQRFIHTDCESDDDLARMLGDSFFGHPKQSGLAALTRQGLLEGARQFAASTPWPDDAMDREEHARQLEAIQQRQGKIGGELDRLREQADHAGIVLR